MKPLSTIDSFCLYADSPHAGLHGAFLQIYAGKPGESTAARFKRLLKHIESRLDASPVFRRRIERMPLDVDRALWVDGGDVDLHYHVRHTALPKPGNEAQLADAYAHIYARQMDMTRPLWEIHVIDGLDHCERVPANSFALIVKFHHAGFDGVTAVDITSVLHSSDKSSTKHAASLPSRKAKEKLPEWSDRLLDGAQFYTRVGTALMLNLPSISAALVKQLLPRQPKAGPKLPAAPHSLLNGLISNDRSFTYLGISLADIKQIRERVPESTVNDAYLAICGGALRLFLGDVRALPKASLIAACPVNIRAEHEKGAGGNKFGMMRVPLFTDEADPLKRLQRIAAFTSAAKATMGGRSGTRKSMAWLDMLPAPLLALASAALRGGRIAGRISPIVNLIVTNVPGPRDPIYLDGYELVDMFGVPPVADGAGLIIGTTSYRSQLRIAVGACRTIMPDPEKMQGFLRESAAALLSNPGAAKRKRVVTKQASPKGRPTFSAFVAEITPAKKVAAKKKTTRSGKAG